MEPLPTAVVAVLGALVILVSRRMAARDRERIATWEPVMGEAVDKEAEKRTDALGFTAHYLSVSVAGHGDERFHVTKATFNSVEIGSEIRLALHPDKDGKLVHPDIPLPATTAVFFAGLIALILGLVFFIGSFFIET